MGTLGSLRMASSWLWLSSLMFVTVTVVSSKNCLNPDTAQTCSGSGLCKVDTCQCYPGYEGQWCETCKSCDKKCGQIGGCVECKLFNTGPAEYAQNCGSCKYLTAVILEDVKPNDFDPRKSKLSKNGTCQIVDDSGCDFTFWYGYDSKNKLRTWSDKSNRVCPPSEEKDVVKECSKKSTCTDCEQSPGCDWCSSPHKDLASRCSSIKENEKICPTERIEKKFRGGPTIIKESREQKFAYDWVQLRPQQVKLEMNVGDIKYLNFTYMFINSGTSFSHDLPDNVELKIFSVCDGLQLKEREGCYGILNGQEVQFYARFHMKSCPEKASDWEKSYKLTLSQGDALDIDMNPCAKKNSCSECLRDSACNWCSGSKFSYFDGSPLPRCNNDSFFTSDLCPASGRVDPAQALTGSEDCSSCKHTCSGGICSEDKKDLLELNTCVSHLTCGDCTQAEGCAWCSQTEGAPMCNLVKNWIQGNETKEGHRQTKCQGNLFENKSNISSDEALQNTGCGCERKCYEGYEKQPSSCRGGNRKCGVCQDCPDGSFGEFCQCAKDGSVRQPSQLKGLPSVVIGKKDDLAGAKQLEDAMSFSHSIVPKTVSPDSLKCNATYCMNTNSRECYQLGEKDSKFDLARSANLFAIYGDHHLLPGAELIFRFTYCPLKLGYWGTHETRFGFGTPPSQDNNYTLTQKGSHEMLKFWSDDVLAWETEGIERGDSTLQSVDYGHGRWDEGTYGNGKPYRTFSTYTPAGIKGYIGYVKQKIDTDIKLVVTETEVIWSWEGFNSTRLPDLTELKQSIDMTEKEYFPLFLLPGCETDGDFSSVTIVSSKLGKN